MTLTLNTIASANPGDAFTIALQGGGIFAALWGTQYHVQISPYTAGAVIGLWNPDGTGLARNKPGLSYLDRTPSQTGIFKITVTGQGGPYNIVVFPNSWFQKQFGSSIQAVTNWLNAHDFPTPGPAPVPIPAPTPDPGGFATPKKPRKPRKGK